jgi:hypothetical protein
MKKIIFLTLLVVSSLQLYSQNVSTPKAIMFSAILPGSGHLYIQKNTKAGMYFASEIGIIYSFFRFKAEKDWVTNSYKKYAYSTIGLDSNSTENRYQLVQEYYNSEEYNENVKAYARDVYLIFQSPPSDPNEPQTYYEFLDENLITDEEGWHWQSLDNWKRYRDLRYKKQDYEILKNFSLAALILNRFISVIDVAISSRKINKAIQNLSFSPDFNNNRMIVSYEIKF